MTEEPDDYEGKWPKGEAPELTVDTVMVLVKDYACRSFIPGSGMKEAHDKLRSALEKLFAEVETLKLQRTAADIVGRETANIVLLQVGEIASLKRVHNIIDRWNIDLDERDGTLLVCKGEHEKHEPCKFERYVPQAESEALRNALERIVKLTTRTYASIEQAAVIAVAALEKK